MSYLPTSIRLRIEELFRKRDGGIHTIFCTSTLLEGVNLPADNLFITDYKNGSYPMSAVEFRNLIGRVGRIQYSLYGNAFLVCLPDVNIEPTNYVSLLRKEVEPQILSIDTISDKEKEYVRDCLKEGKTKLEKLNGQTNEAFALMRKAANILLRDIMLDRKGRIKIELTGNPIGIDLSSLSIEHIMPQTINEYWASVSGLDEDHYTSVVNRIGNLTLAAASDNSKMGNNDFAYKKTVLASTKHLKLNADIYTKESWTVKDIEDRTQFLIDQIIALFPYVQSTYKETKECANRHITLSVGSLMALGYLNEDNSLTVFAGSEVRYSTSPNAGSLKELRDELLDQEIVEYNGGRYIFAQDYTFNSPSTATDFLLGGSNNGWNYWKVETGQTINEALRK